MSGTLNRAAELVKANPCGVLLAAQVLGIVLYAFLELNPADAIGRLVLSLFGMFVLVMALRVVRATPALTWLGVVIGIPAAILTVVDGLTGSVQPWHLWSDVTHLLFYGYTLVGLLLYMFADEEVSSDEILAIGATFTVGVWLFAYAYSIVQTLAPGSFLAATNAGAPLTWMELLFLSATNMTATGLSDIVPIKPHARAVVTIQQIAGVLYVAVAVGRIVSLTGRRRAARGGSSP